jgi:proteasome accessory factor B
MMKTRKISRIIQILTVLQSGKSYSADDLARMFDTTRRTIFRDLKELRGIGLPYHYDAKTKCYYVEPEFFLPPTEFNLQEALSLFLLVHTAGKHIQLPFRNSAQLAVMKIANNLPAEIKKSCNIALENISAKAHSHAPLGPLSKIFAELQHAITNKNRLQMSYHSLFEGGAIDVEVCPYHIHYNRRAWYLIGFSELHGEIRTFKLNRIRRLRTLKTRFVQSGGFDMDEYLGRAWSMIPEGRIYNVRLRFLPKVANNVAEVHWHSTQQITWNSDDSVTLEFRIDGLGEIMWWVLGYGDQVQVLAPKLLRNRVVQAARNIIKLNEKL